MGLVINWANVLARYAELDKLPDVGSTTVQDNIISMAEGELHSRLAARYAVPFSSNNVSAVSLAVDMVYVQSQLTRQPEKAKALAKSIDDRIEALLSGKALMITSSGSALTMVGDTVWSSTEDYPPVFGMSPIEEAVVSSQQVYDERATRGEY